MANNETEIYNKRDPLFITILLSLLGIRIIIVSLTKFFFSPVPSLVISLVELIAYILLAIILYYRFSEIQKYNIDSASFLSIIFFTMVAHLPTKLAFSEICISIAFWSVSIILYIRYRKKGPIPQNHRPLILFISGVLIGLISFFGFNILPFIFDKNFQLEMLYSPLGSFVTICTYFLAYLGQSVIFEEFLFRGLLMGFLQQKKLPFFLINLIQTALFFFAHIADNKKFYYLFIVLPAISYILGMVSQRKKTVFANIFIHGTYNYIGLIFKGN